MPVTRWPSQLSYLICPHYDFDVLQGQGDTVTATLLPDRPGHVEIESIEGDGGRLTLEAPKNCVGIAAIETLKLLGSPSCGVSLKLQKVLPPIMAIACLCASPSKWLTCRNCSAGRSQSSSGETMCWCSES